MPEASTPLAARTVARTAASVTVDNLLRRELRVGNPADPDQVASGLLARYPLLADQLKREREGFNYATGAQVAAAAAIAVPTSSGLELAQAQDDLERDAATLVNSSELKDIQIELTGWTRAVRNAAADGLAAAAMGLDIVQHDRAMAARRTLGDYARLARYVGAASADSGPIFRRFAQSCDSLAGLILVAIGDALAANGVTRGTALIRASASDLQARRDTIITALRALVGSGSARLGQGEYPRGLIAYRSLIEQLEQAGQSDLRILLNESALALELDRLVDLAAGGSPASLRELSTTSSIVVERLSRLVSYCHAVPVDEPDSDIDISPESPPMTFFAAAIQMFLDAFTNAAGTRLLYIARPAIVTYGLYGLAGMDNAAYRLLNLTIIRNQLAEAIDCVATCGCDGPAIAKLVILDYLLYRLDRAIDLYAVSSSAEGDGEPEHRASALAYLIDAAKAISDRDNLLVAPIDGALESALDHLRGLLSKGLRNDRARGSSVILFKELNGAYYAEEAVERLLRALCPACAGVFLLNYPIPGQSGGAKRPLIRELIAVALNKATGKFPSAPSAINIPADRDATGAMMAANRPMYRFG